MTDAIFCKTRYQDHGYASYNDFWRLVELAGYPVIYVDQIDAYDRTKTYIFTPLNGETLAGWPGATARIILWELEWRIGDWRATINTPPGISETWTSDKWYAEKIGARYVPMGSDAKLKIAGPLNYDEPLDVAYLGYMVPRRQVIAVVLGGHGVRVSPASAWGFERDAVLRASRAYLHVHQHDNMPGIPALRMVVAAAYGLPVLSESVADAGIFNGGPGKKAYILQADYQELAAKAQQICEPGNPIQYFGLALRNLLCEDLTFRKSVEAAL